jgi:O-antigen/teichoic acid export membrane protein
LSKKYLEVSWSLPLLMIGNAIYCIGQLSIYEVYFYKKPKLLIASNVVPGLISLSAGFFLIKYYGYLGAVASNLIAFASSGIITFYVTQKFSKKRAYAY